MQYRRISADCHLDMIWLPPDLFTSQAGRALKDEMPYVKEQPDGSKRWIDNNGADYGKAGGVGAVGSEYVPGKQLRVDKMHEAGLYDDFTKKGLRRPGDPHLRVKELDRDGVDAEVIYGILAACAKIKNPAAANEMLRIYNDFMHDFCSHYPNRDDRPRLPAVQRHRGGGGRSAPRRQARHEGRRAVLLVAHDADVAPDVGPAVGGGQRDAAAAALPHLPGGRPGTAQARSSRRSRGG